MAEIGALEWRFQNYGLRRLIRYFVLDGIVRRLGLLGHKYQAVDEINSIEVISSFMGLKSTEVAEIRFMARDFLIDLEASFSSQGQVFKAGVVGSHGPISRLTLIGCLIKKFLPDAYIETGTQHGVSAEFASSVSKELGLATKVISIDVDSRPSIVANSGYDHQVLSSPCGENFVSKLQELKYKFDKTIFAHDSDHTYEHMSWELERAQRILTPLAIICDDIEQHRAFFNFSKNFRTPYLAVESRQHGLCGVVLLSDPDGT